MASGKKDILLGKPNLFPCSECWTDSPGDIFGQNRCPGGFIIALQATKKLKNVAQEFTNRHTGESPSLA